jgi:hypothetical protein
LPPPVLSILVTGCWPPYRPAGKTTLAAVAFLLSVAGLDPSAAHTTCYAVSCNRTVQRAGHAEELGRGSTFGLFVLIVILRL